MDEKKINHERNFSIIFDQRARLQYIIRIIVENILIF